MNVVTHSSLADPDFLASAVEQYNNNRSGILTNLGGDLAGTVKSPFSGFGSNLFFAMSD